MGVSVLSVFSQVGGKTDSCSRCFTSTCLLTPLLFVQDLEVFSEEKTDNSAVINSRGMSELSGADLVSTCSLFKSLLCEASDISHTGVRRW